jgi:glycolate oxidase iron-sulfur subunit
VAEAAVAVGAAPEPGLRSCVHCGLCHQACPTYVELGTEADSPRGRIALMRAIEEGKLDAGDPEARAHLDLCLGCRACETACPSGVPYGMLIEEARAAVEARRPAWRRAGRRLLARMMTSRVGLAPLRLVARLPGRAALARATRIEWLAFAAALPGPVARGHEVLEPEGRPAGTAVLQTGCVTEALFGELNRTAAALLRLAGWRVVVPAGQGCCGALAAHLGDAGLAAAQRARLVSELRGRPADVVVSTAAGCGAHLAPDGARDVLAVLAGSRLPPPGPLRPIRVAVHEPCHLVHGQGVSAEVRGLLAAIPGVDLVSLAEADLCCGSAGTYNLTQREMARRLLDRKLGNVRASGADVVAAANPGCLLQMRAGAIRRGEAFEVRHPLEVLAAAYGLGSASLSA